MTSRQGTAASVSATALIDALKNRLNALSDQELATAIGVGKSTISTWRRRGAVPPRVARDIGKRFGLTPESVVAGLERDRGKVEELHQAALFMLLVLIVRERPGMSASDLARSLPVLFRWLEKAIVALPKEDERYEGIVGAATILLDIEGGMLNLKAMLDRAEALEREASASKFLT